MQGSAFLVAALSGVSALLGVALGHIFAAKRARQDELAAMRMAAYVDFLKSTSLLFTARRAGRTKDEVEELAHLNDAKARILLTADLPVAKSLQKFWLQGGTLEKEQEILAFSTLCFAMFVSGRMMGKMTMMLMRYQATRIAALASHKPEPRISNLARPVDRISDMYAYP